MTMMRTPPMWMDPVPMAVGDSVRFADSGRWWKVRAVSDRFVILTSPNNLPRLREYGPFYTVIDWERGVRGPDDHYGVGYATDDEIADALRRLNLTPHTEGWIEVSWRAHSIRVDIASLRQS